MLNKWIKLNDDYGLITEEYPFGILAVDWFSPVKNDNKKILINDQSYYYQVSWPLDQNDFQAMNIVLAEPEIN
jgi:hypothetical protein